MAPKYHIAREICQRFAPRRKGMDFSAYTVFFRIFIPIPDFGLAEAKIFHSDSTVISSGSERSSDQNRAFSAKDFSLRSK
uniref:Uncharacterized protein n=1 Tax=Candidatus Kentrum sp. UNK TaxID=2126344 RepID=A0A451AP24_9GAMM|nr:MAG: hypothetical protein BECKUNK1418G_GA0071005_11675 [Candidatus Kentron sp. UNK]VFK69155.1 MAG: hypothetical protein BECKUNK1418H_GA0071006_10115 [Candidatus Kentron sp. UNK]